MTDLGEGRAAHKTDPPSLLYQNSGLGPRCGKSDQVLPQGHLVGTTELESPRKSQKRSARTHSFCLLTGWNTTFSPSVRILAARADEDVASGIHVCRAPEFQDCGGDAAGSIFSNFLFKQW